MLALMLLLRSASPLRPAARRLFSTRLNAEKKRLIFLGSPGVAAQTLQGLLDASRLDGACFDVVGAVSQPPAAKGRKKVVQRSEVHALAEDNDLPTLTPESARDLVFLDALRDLRPDVFVTAAYGQFLPKKLLEIAPFGTLNIHPSLLPRWRGAAPLQRSLEAGDNLVGVTVLQTVLAMDAGPIVAQHSQAVREGDDAEALLTELFAKGVDLLVAALPALFDGTLVMQLQKDAEATAAPKLARDDGRLDLLAPVDDESRTIAARESRTIAARARDKVRAFAGWPGTFVDVRIGAAEAVRLKVLAARLPGANDAARDGASTNAGACALSALGDALLVSCADGSTLALLTVQKPNGKPMPVAAFWNGLRGEPLAVVEPLVV
ncbi:formyl transferase [Pelagophyceae sp. CCMP2097]|nr:formyl transferase [Pelagophyceae sp. CCMP2097]